MVMKQTAVLLVLYLISLVRPLLEQFGQRFHLLLPK